MTKRTAKLVCFGKGGDSVEFGGGCSSSGYGNPERPHAAAPDGELVIPDGTPVIDKRAAVETDAGYRFVFKGPMVNVDLEPGRVDRLDISGGAAIMAAAMVSDPGNQFGRLVTLHEGARAAKAEYGPLDQVDTATYVELWRQAGARIGHYKGGVIVWDE